ncbi:hypothetical protein BJ165DRAFT_1501974 [Panaeolus papilionaceus]|nr:hypothetical protein BJ165DRAFT_1501974 [Panaeolus papilionaceus]
MPEVNGIIWADLHSVRPIFLTLHISGGLVGMPLLVATFLFAKKIHKRQPVFINFCITWILYSAVYVLLGHTGRPINPAMCYIQTAFIMAAPPMVGTSTTLVVYKIWWTFRTAQNTEYRSRPQWLKVLSQILLLGSPYFVFILYTIISIAFQIKYPGTFDERNGVYCTAYGVNARQWLVPIFCVLSLVFMLLFQTLLIKKYYNNRRRLLRSFPLLDKGTSRNLVIRIGLFNLYLLVSFGAGIEFIRAQGGDTPWPYMIQAGLPLAGFICFATQKDILSTWKIWHGRRTTQTSSTEHIGTSASASRPGTDYPMNPYKPGTIRFDVSQVSNDRLDKSPHGHGRERTVSHTQESLTQNSAKFVPITLPSNIYSVTDTRREK